MAINTISTGRPMKVPQPSSTPNFVLGSRPSVLRSPAISAPRIKPEAASTRDYGKPQPAPFAGGKPFGV